MKIITAIENKKINEHLKNINNIKIQNSDIQYKEGILEYLEKNNNIDIIILKDNLPGQIDLFNLIKEIQKMNNRIKIFILINNNNCEKFENIKNIEYFYLEKITVNNILKILNLHSSNNKEKVKNKIITFSGNRGVGKTTFIIAFSKIISEIKNKKILLIDENENKILTKIFFKNNYNNLTNNNEIIKIENNIYLLNINYLINNKINVTKYLNKIKNNFNYIIFDIIPNCLKKYENIIYKNIYLLEPNIIEIEKAKKYLIYNNIEIIINKKNTNTIDKKIINKTFNKKILGEINYSRNINLFINNDFNINKFDNIEIKNYLKIINKIMEE